MTSSMLSAGTISMLLGSKTVTSVISQNSVLLDIFKNLKKTVKHNCDEWYQKEKKYGSKGEMVKAKVQIPGFCSSALSTELSLNHAALQKSIVLKEYSKLDGISTELH